MGSKGNGSGGGVRRHGALAGLLLALALVAGAASGGDNAAWVSYSDVPMWMEPGEEVTVTVTMRNTGTTTWETTTVRQTTQGAVTTTHTSFRLDSVGQDWGVGSEAVSGRVTPGAETCTYTVTDADGDTDTPPRP